MTLSYVDTDPFKAGPDGPFAQYSLDKLISSILEPKDPGAAFPSVFRLIYLLLLSNRIDKAYELICAVYKHAKDILPYSQDSYPVLRQPLPIEYFWHTHQSTHPRPENAVQYEGFNKQQSDIETYLAKQQWGKYRESCRTGWMLEHCRIREPKDPHSWQDSDNLIMLAMCARLLAKNKKEGQYPSPERTREALAVAKKLYELPEAPITEWRYDGTSKIGAKRHSYLLYRRLAIELAIRVGELETAAEFLSLGLRLDGFNALNGGDVHDYLFVPGIYDVLPLLAKRGKEGNPFFISGDSAEVMVREIIGILELRAREGRQWSLAPEKVGWKELLDRLAQGAWKVNRKEYRNMDVTCAEDILYPPATEEQIRAVEKRLGELPADFKEMVRIANGFKGGWHFLSGGIAGISDYDVSEEEIDNHAPDFAHLGFKDYGDISGDMLQLQAGSECDAFYHYIIPPSMWKDNVEGREVKDGEYKYWHWAPWQASIQMWDSVRDWVASLVEEVEEMVEKGEKVDKDDDEDEDEDNVNGAVKNDEDEISCKDGTEEEDDWVKVDVTPDENPSAG